MQLCVQALQPHLEEFNVQRLHATLYAFKLIFYTLVPMAAKSKLIDARRDFDLPKDELNKLTRVYLNAASRTPLMKETVEVGQVAMARQMQTPWSIASEEDELKIREAFATLISTPSKWRVWLAPL